MSRKSRRIKAMGELLDLVREWMRDVQSIGNETAYSDDIIRHVYNKAKEIKEQLDKELKNECSLK